MAAVARMPDGTVLRDRALCAAVMGRYFPRSSYSTEAAFEALGCPAVSGPGA